MRLSLWSRSAATLPCGCWNALRTVGLLVFARIARTPPVPPAYRTKTKLAGILGIQSFVLPFLVSLGMVMAAPTAMAEGTPVLQSTGDADGDGILDEADNCITKKNADQRDTDGDGYGNICDPDFNNNNIVDPTDFSLAKSLFGKPPGPSAFH